MAERTYNDGEPMSAEDKRARRLLTVAMWAVGLLILAGVAVLIGGAL